MIRVHISDSSVVHFLMFSPPVPCSSSISGDKEIFTYFYAPIGALLIINILLFVSTTRQLTCGLWKRDDVKTTTEKSVTLFVRCLPMT